MESSARKVLAQNLKRLEVLDAFRQGRDRGGYAYWSVRCSSGAALQIRIAPDGDGSTRILDYAVIARTAAPACFSGM